MTDRLLTAALLEQRRALRRRLQAQRQLVVSQFEPLPVRQRYRPRSKTMRFFTQQPALAAGLLATVATLLIGVRFLRALTTMLAVTRLLSSVSDRSAQFEVGAEESRLPESASQASPVAEVYAQVDHPQGDNSQGDSSQRQTADTPSRTEFVTL